MRGTARTVLAVPVAIVAALSLSACAEPTEQPLQPSVKPPAIAKEGVLTAGVDLTYPPFAGEDAGVKAGLDIDVAAAIAERLGLKLALIGASPKDAARKLREGKVDIVAAALPINDALLSEVAFAGSYANDGPVFFVAVADTDTPTPAITMDTLGARKIGVQTGSTAYWQLSSELGDEGVVAFSSAREAFIALTSGEVDAVAADGIAGSYIARDFPTVRFAGQLSPAIPLGVAVRKDAPELETAVREALDALAADGVLEVLRSKWATPLPELEVAPAQ